MFPSVLVADDDPTAVAMRLLVACEPTMVGETDSVASASSTATELKPAAALVDVGLPGGDGFTLARALTALPPGPRVVPTSVDADPGEHDAVRRSSALPFVHKAGLRKAALAQLFGGDEDQRWRSRDCGG